VRRLRELGWGALGFLAALLLFLGGAALLGYHVERTTHRTVVKRVAPHRQAGSAEGGDALQPASAGQQHAPAPAGDTGSSEGGGKGAPAPHKPVSHPPVVPPPPGSNGEQSQTTPAPAPTAGSAQSEEPPPAQPEGSESETPGLLTPALTTVCSIADHLAHLC
jgi:hypothetical protein